MEENKELLSINEFIREVHVTGNWDRVPINRLEPSKKKEIRKIESPYMYEIIADQLVSMTGVEVYDSIIELGNSFIKKKDGHIHPIIGKKYAIDDRIIRKKFNNRIYYVFCISNADQSVRYGFYQMGDYLIQLDGSDRLIFFYKWMTVLLPFISSTLRSFKWNINELTKSIIDDSSTGLVKDVLNKFIQETKISVSYIGMLNIHFSLCREFELCEPDDTRIYKPTNNHLVSLSQDVLNQLKIKNSLIYFCRRVALRYIFS
jgi:hypothetical protein